MKLNDLFEANGKATFTKVTSFDSWNDKNGGNYDETQVDGHLVGVLYSADDKAVIGLWYNKFKYGTVSKDFAKKFPKYADDPVAYSEQDPHWPEAWNN